MEKMRESIPLRGSGALNQKDGNGHEGRGRWERLFEHISSICSEARCVQSDPQTCLTLPRGVCGVGSEGGRESSENELGKRTSWARCEKEFFFFEVRSREHGGSEVAEGSEADAEEGAQNGRQHVAERRIQVQWLLARTCHSFARSFSDFLCFL